MGEGRGERRGERGERREERGERRGGEGKGSPAAKNNVQRAPLSM